MIFNNERETVEYSIGTYQSISRSIKLHIGYRLREFDQKARAKFERLHVGLQESIDALVSIEA